MSTTNQTASHSRKFEENMDKLFVDRTCLLWETADATATTTTTGTTITKLYNNYNNF